MGPDMKGKLSTSDRLQGIVGSADEEMQDWLLETAEALATGGEAEAHPDDNYVEAQIFNGLDLTDRRQAEALVVPHISLKEAATLYDEVGINSEELWTALAE